MAKTQITEREVEGIYAELNYKRETVPGYDEAFKRLFEGFKDMIDGKGDTEYDKAMFDLFMIEMCGGQDK